MNIDWTFGLRDSFPGLGKLATIQGPIEFWRGFIFGSAVSNHTTLDLCDANVQQNFVNNMIMANNATGDIFRSPNMQETIFNTYDLLLVVANIADGLYPIANHCWGAGEWIIAHYMATIG